MSGGCIIKHTAHTYYECYSVNNGFVGWVRPSDYNANHMIRNNTCTPSSIIYMKYSEIIITLNSKCQSVGGKPYIT